MSELSLNVVSNEALKMREKKKRKVKKIKRKCESRERKGKERKRQFMGMVPRKSKAFHSICSEISKTEATIANTHERKKE